MTIVEKEPHPLRKPFRECGFAYTGASRQAPILFIHDRFDKVASHDETERSLAVFSQAKLCSTTGLGHRRIFSNASVAKIAADFMIDDHQAAKKKWGGAKVKALRTASALETSPVFLTSCDFHVDRAINVSEFLHQVVTASGVAFFIVQRGDFEIARGVSNPSFEPML